LVQRCDVYIAGIATSVAGGQPQLKICNVIINYNGLNLPCFEPADQLYITTTGSPPYDQLVWNLGRIRNSAQRSIHSSTVVPCLFQCSIGHSSPPRSVLCCRLHLPSAKPEARCPHFPLQISFPDVSRSSSFSVAL